MPFRIDHVVWGVRNLEAASAEVPGRFGLASVKGGRHPGWGTENCIVPLGPNYLELIAIADEDEAGRDPVGRLWLQLLRQGEGLAAWCLATDDIDGVASRLGLEVRWKWRILPDGSEVAWRTAGLEKALQHPALPFFISWDVAPDQHPGRMYAGGADAVGIRWVRVGADPGQFAEWVGDEPVPVRFGGSPRVNAVGLSLPSGEVVIE